MKTLKITTDNKISIVDVDFKDFRSIQQAVGGYFETVKTRKMWDYFKAPVIMLVDEEGLIKGLSCNAVASVFYGIEEHGCMIAGDVIFGLVLGEDIIGFGNQLYKSLCTIRDRYNVRFEFCEKKDTGKEIMRILSGGGGDPR